MLKSNPLVSVLMPAYNAEKYIAAAIESILKQTFSDFELIIINDGSTDQTPEIIEEYSQKDSRVIVLKNEKNLGICSALNRGLENARGIYLARMDADDWSYPERLKLQLDFLQDHPEVVIVGGMIEVCDQDLRVLNRRSYPLTDEEIRKKILRLNPFAHPATFYRLETAKKVGGYNPHLVLVEDYDFYFRLGNYGKFGNLPQTILKLRTYPASYSFQNISNQSRLNLYVRLKTVNEYGYSMGWLDKLFLAANFLAIFLIPNRLKFWLFNLWRRFYH